LGLIGIPSSIGVTGTVAHNNSDGPADVTMPRPIPVQSRRHSSMTINSSDLGSTNLLAVPTGGPRDGSGQTLEQVLRSDTAAPSREVRSRGTNLEEARPDTIGRHSINSIPSSASSWGTVDTSARGSMSDLGLIGLHRGGVRGQGSIGDAEEDVEAGTPRVRPANLPLGFVAEPRATLPQGYVSEDERPRHLRSLSYPEPPVIVIEDHDRHITSQGGHTTRPNHQRRHSLAQSVSLDSGALPPSVYGSQSTGNALALTFDASTANDASVPSAINTRGVSPNHIRAPAPRVGGPNVLNLWRPDI